MNPLLREHAPITEEAWKEIEDEIKGALDVNLGARRVVDVDGPLGWDHGARATGRTEKLAPGTLGSVDVRRRSVLPLIELETRFDVGREELESLGRGAKDVDLSAAVEAAERIARAEDRAIFHGYREGGIGGIVERSEHAGLPISEDYTNYPSTVVAAIEKLRSSGIGGPFAIVLGPRCYTGLLTASDPSGYPALMRLERIVDGPIVRAPALDGAVVISQRGGDFELTIGQDLALGYASHTADSVRFRLIESFAFRALTPDAAVPLVYSS